MRILIGSDDRDLIGLRYGLCNRLEYAGHSVELTTTHAEFIQRLLNTAGSDEKFDAAVLTIIGLSEVSGHGVFPDLTRIETNHGFRTGLVVAKRLASIGLLPKKCAIVTPRGLFSTVEAEAEGKFTVIDDSNSTEIVSYLLSE